MFSCFMRFRELLRQYALLSSLMCMALTGCSPSESKVSEVQTGVGGPHLFVPNRSRTVGVIGLTRHEEKFVIQNRGSADLHIRRVTTSCGCTKVKLSASTVPAHGEVALLAVISPSQPESRSARIELETDDRASRKYDLQLSWIARGPLEVAPEIIDFGYVRSGQPSRRIVTLKRNMKLDGANAKVLRIAAEPKGVLTVVALRSPPNDLKSLQQYEVTVNAVEGHEASGVVRFILAENAEESAQILVPVVWNVRDLIEVTPKRVFLGSNVIGSAVAGAILITSDKGTSLSVGKSTLASHGP